MRFCKAGKRAVQQSIVRRWRCAVISCLSICAPLSGSPLQIVYLRLHIVSSECVSRIWSETTEFGFSCDLVSEGALLLTRFTSSIPRMGGLSPSAFLGLMREVAQFGDSKLGVGKLSHKVCVLPTFHLALFAPSEVSPVIVELVHVLCVFTENKAA